MTTDDKPSTSLVVAGGKLQLLRPIAPVEELIQQRSELVTLLPKVLTEGVDYGVIPGTGEKKALLKPGAERVCIIFGCHPTYEIIDKEIEHDRVVEYRSGWVTAEEPSRDEKERLKKARRGRNKKIDGEWVWQERGDGTSTSLGLYRYVFRCVIVRQDGLVVADGVGSCSTLESKYIDRPRDLENTVLKMAQKRALVAAVLNGFGLSDRFTQDVEDDVIEIETPFDRPTQGGARASASRPTTPGASADRRSGNGSAATTSEPRRAQRSPEELVVSAMAVVDGALEAKEVDQVERGWRQAVERGLVVDEKVQRGMRSYIRKAQSRLLGIPEVEPRSPEAAREAELDADAELHLRQLRARFQIERSQADETDPASDE
jgi:hypothetical protein